MSKYKWRLYAKHSGQKRFSPVDWNGGYQVVNLIHATLFTDVERDQVESDLLKCVGMNKGMTWQFRAVKHA